MAPPRTSLAGRRGWTTVVSLGAVLTCVAAVQLPAAFAEAPAAAGAVPQARSTVAVAGLDATERVPARRVGFPVPSAAVVPAAVVLAPVVLAPASQVLPSAPAPASAPARVVRASAVPPAVPVAVAKPAAPANDLCSGAGWEQRRGEAALASLRGDAARTGFTVTFESARSGYLGLTYLNEKRIAVHVRSCAKESDELLRHVMAHELGHAWDTNHMNSTSRAAYMAARGIPASTPWYGCSGCTDFATPAGDFAEVYAQWSRGASSNKSLLAGDASTADLTGYAAQFFGA